MTQPQPGPIERAVRDVIVPALCLFIALAAVFWALGGPVRLGLQIYAEQLLVSVLAATLAVCFLTRRARRRAPVSAPIPVYDYLLAALAIGHGVYLTWVFPTLATSVFFRPTEAIIVSSIGLVLLLEGLRRAVGWALVVILGLVVFYALFSSNFGGVFAGRSIPARRIVNFLVLDSAAMAGAALYIAVSVVIPFVLLAQLLLGTGGSQFFSDLSAALMGRYRGGAGKIAIVGSALMGTVSGSAVSNVASTGGITIPLMKSSGYPARTAAAIEATASTGGQLMPPVMGAAAFLMAENLQVPYSQVVLASIVPSILYFLSIFVFADLEAGRRGIKPLSADRIPALLGVLGRGWFLFLPFVVLIVGLFNFGLRAETAAIYAVGTLFLLALVRTYDGGRIGWRDLVDTLVKTGQGSIEIVIICAAAGMIIGIVGLSGLSFGLGFFLIQMGQSSLLLLLVVTGIVCILMGMGLPTVGVYLLLATLAAPPLVELGLSPMAAHMFVMYFGMLSMITPPVAIAAFVAANMAGTEPMRTSVEAVRVGWPAFVIPFLFVASPSLLLAGTPVDNAVALVTACLGVALLTAAIAGFAAGHMTLAQRAMMTVPGALLLLPPEMLPMAPLVYLAAGVAGIVLWRATRNGVAPLARRA
jgi:TRAP transporter 4TM/12TM fusion protein